MLTTIGLIVICIAWVYELYLVLLKGDRVISFSFVGLYMIGVLLLVIDGFMSGVSSIVWANLASLIISVAVFISLLKK